MKPVGIWMALLIGLGQSGCATAVSSVTAEGLAEPVKLYSTLSGVPLPHAMDESHTLEFKGRRYPHFFGAGYAIIPERNAIVFFTKRETILDFSTYLHIVPLHEGKEVTLNLGETSLGSGFGYPPESTSAHFIEKIEGDNIFFVIVYDQTEGSHYVVNLKTGELKRLGLVKLEEVRPSGQAKPVQL
jgi:hypothetical protein